MITIIGAGSLDEEKAVSVKAEELIGSADVVIYQSSRQSCYEDGRLTLDHIFEEAEDFDEFAVEAAKYIGEQKGNVVFVAIGDGVNNNVGLELCKNYEDVEIVEGHICGCVSTAAKLGKLSFDRLCYIDAYDYLEKKIDTGCDIVITGLDDGLMFWDIKARLMDYYPENHQIFINKTCVLLEDADYKEPCDIFLPKLTLLEKKRYSYDDLMDIVRELRQKCPWDREQTHKSIRSNLVEECYELYEAIDKGDSQMMLEEMGDVLLQVCLHNIFECEHGDMVEDDVTTLICQKLIRRHPHVYGEEVFKTEAEVKSGWDAIKKQEYNLTSKSDELRHISKYLPALMGAYKTIKKARKQGIEISGSISEMVKDIDGGNSLHDNCGRLLLLAVKLCLDKEEHPYVALKEIVNGLIATVAQMETQGKLTNEKIVIDIKDINTEAETEKMG